MASMNSKTRQRIIDVCKKQGFDIQLKADDSDLYDKNLVFLAGKSLRIFIRRDTGINKSSGDLNYLKLAVHPDHFKESVIDPSSGIESLLNQRSKINRHSSSNYVGFPTYEGNSEPCGKCYKVDGLIALEKLLVGLQKL